MELQDFSTIRLCRAKNQKSYINSVSSRGIVPETSERRSVSRNPGLPARSHDMAVSLLQVDR